MPTIEDYTIRDKEIEKDWKKFSWENVILPPFNYILKLPPFV